MGVNQDGFALDLKEMVEMLRMRSIGAVLAGGMLAFTLTAPALVACADEVTPEDQAPVNTSVMTGGWEVSTAPSIVTDEQRQIFDTVMAGYMGVTLEPVAVIATQVVAGTNYAFLTQATPISPDTAPYWTVVVIYQDLAGNVSFTCMNDLDVADIKTVETDGSQMYAGAWQAQDPEGAGMLDQKAATAFSAALEGYTGMSFDPIATLGTQLVAGTNYRILCAGTTVTAEPQTGLYVLTIYEDLSGNVELTDVSRLDINAYVTPPVVEEVDAGAATVSATPDTKAGAKASAKPSASRILEAEEELQAEKRFHGASAELLARQA